MIMVLDFSPPWWQHSKSWMVHQLHNLSSVSALNLNVWFKMVSSLLEPDD
ncbi:hypothetical protein DsansV1_C06g0059161 [Dioscorea sansibarensis]